MRQVFLREFLLRNDYRISTQVIRLISQTQLVKLHVASIHPLTGITPSYDSPSSRFRAKKTPLASATNNMGYRFPSIQNIVLISANLRMRSRTA